ncbi:thioredoxin [Phytoactinopolyspora alkaliphila]|uniref:Thioredoxin n=1 Tax=Phytoactinopolyspora alkaliphila TaxID=1783498 RepID=A0A6N9YKB6_9ACTN|nr:thioredoxin [Phytoactinopolyspora alkaliphila]NED95350.1 thioredoxin [Phytoactinopolyspora alkaliphila]
MSPTTAPGDVLVVTDETFAPEVLAHELPVLVDFWAEWCPPCHAIAPMLTEIARERAGSLAIRKLNTDENPVVASTYRVMSLPTLMLFRDGEPVQALVGARPKARLLAELDAALRQ